MGQGADAARDQALPAVFFIPYGLARRPIMRKPIIVPAVLVVAALVLGACGSSGNKRAKAPSELTAAEPAPYSQDIDLSRPAWQRGPNAGYGRDRLP
jgi:hypothetical protein